MSRVGLVKFPMQMQNGYADLNPRTGPGILVSLLIKSEHQFPIIPSPPQPPSDGGENGILGGIITHSFEFSGNILLHFSLSLSHISFSEF